jgi:hypothetical protein
MLGTADTLLQHVLGNWKAINTLQVAKSTIVYYDAVSKATFVCSAVLHSAVHAILHKTVQVLD